jgi:general secretion pathway protein D
VPLLGQIPLLGHLFANDKGSKTKTEIILSITPHIVGNKKIPDAREMEYWSGTDSDLRSNQLVLKPYGEVSLTSSAPGLSATSAPSAPALMPSQRAPVALTSLLPPANPALASTLTPSTPKPMSAPVAASSIFEANPTENTPNTPTDFFWHGPAQAKVGDKITLTLDTQTLAGVKKLNLHVGFDPGVLKVVEVIEGNSMKQNNSSSTLAKVIDQVGGDVSVDLTGSGSSKGGSVVTLTFEVTSPAQETTVTINSIGGNLSNGEAYSPVAPAPYEITVTQ